MEEKGAPTAEVLSELLPKLILSIPFPKSMRWGDRDIRFARPIHWILALFGGEVVHFELDGVKSGELTRGHRFLSPGAFRVKDFESYMHQTRDNYTIVDQDVRREMVRHQVEHAACVNQREGPAGRGPAGRDIVPGGVSGRRCGELRPGVSDRLPKEVLVNSMREHQRYFALDGQGFLMPNFITISNTKAEDMDVVRAGNERVLRARLATRNIFTSTT